MMDGYHDTHGYMGGVEVLLGPNVVSSTPQHHPRAADTSPDPAGLHPIVWRAHFPADIT